MKLAHSFPVGLPWFFRRDAQDDLHLCRNLMVNLAENIGFAKNIGLANRLAGNVIKGGLMDSTLATADKKPHFPTFSPNPAGTLRRAFAYNKSLKNNNFEEVL